MKYWVERSALSALSAFFALLACRGAPAATPAAAVRDSAGIRIVENAGPQWRDGEAWTVADSPLVSIGGKAGDAAYDLAQVSGVVLLEGNRLAVAVGGAWQVRFFDADGTHLASSGRQGRGPGEYQGLAGIWRATGDSVLISDIILRRLTVLSGSGAVGRTFSLGGETGATMLQGGRFSFALPAGTFSDGRVFAFQQAFRVNDAHQGSYRDSADYIVYTGGGAVADTVGRFPGIEMEQVQLSFGGQNFNAPSPVPLGKLTASTIASDRLLIATNAAWEIEDYAVSGELTRIIRLRIPPRPITPRDQAEHRRVSREAIEDQPMMRSLPPQLTKQFLDRVDQAVYPETFPFIVSMQAGTDGTLWVFEQAAPGDEARVYAVLDSAGQFLGRVAFPEKFQPFDFTADRVAGVWKDADDVEHVRVYAIQR